ncbi:helix-turn-helix domain-containing protein (plasmid) [Sphingomonas sp. LaA6.9]|nr:helix-turn-helix domain-containing protein [Sphingomonas sp. LaA6.9]MCJ8159713.1 helix-turn-helix domain-containing protein [Sphingomonas sp. LaA6.9]
MSARPDGVPDDPANDETERARRARKGNPYLVSKQAAAYLGVSASYLGQLRGKGTGPNYRRHAKSYLYHIDDLIAWSNAQSREPKR